jgi:hypothetical protein
MVLSANETVFVLWAFGIIVSLFFTAIVGILNKGVNKMDDMANSLNNMERDFKVLVNDHTNLKEDVKEIDSRVRQLEKMK